MAMLEIHPAELPGREPYFLLTSLVVPRPIAWVSTVSADGVRNLAPHSYFNAVSSNPLIVHFTSTGVKDSLRNVEATGEFVVNIVTQDLVEEMNITAADFPPEEDEFVWAGLEATASSHVTPPRVARVKAAFECKLNQVLRLGNGNMVFGDVVCAHIDESLVRAGRVDPALLQPVGRMGGSTYTKGAAELFEIPRPTWEELRHQR